MDAKTDRFTAGIVAAWVTEILVSLVVGSIYLISAAGGFASVNLQGLGSAVLLIVGTFGFAGAIVGFIASLALGIPILKTFIRYGYTSGPAFLGAGFIISAVLGAVFYVSHQFGEKLMDMDFKFAMLAVFLSGPLASLSFWRVYKQR